MLGPHQVIINQISTKFTKFLLLDSLSLFNLSQGCIYGKSLLDVLGSNPLELIPENTYKSFSFNIYKQVSIKHISPKHSPMHSNYQIKENLVYIESVNPISDLNSFDAEKIELNCLWKKIYTVVMNTYSESQALASYTTSYALTKKKCAGILIQLIFKSEESPLIDMISLTNSRKSITSSPSIRSPLHKLNSCDTYAKSASRAIVNYNHKLNKFVISSNNESKAASPESKKIIQLIPSSSFQSHEGKEKTFQENARQFSNRGNPKAKLRNSSLNMSLKKPSINFSDKESTEHPPSPQLISYEISELNSYLAHDNGPFYNEISDKIIRIEKELQDNIRAFYRDKPNYSKDIKTYRIKEPTNTLHDNSSPPFLVVEESKILTVHVFADQEEESSEDSKKDKKKQNKREARKKRKEEDLKYVRQFFLSYVKHCTNYLPTKFKLMLWMTILSGAAGIFVTIYIYLYNKSLLSQIISGMELFFIQTNAIQSFVDACSYVQQVLGYNL